MLLSISRSTSSPEQVRELQDLLASIDGRVAEMEREKARIDAAQG